MGNIGSCCLSKRKEDHDCEDIDDDDRISAKYHRSQRSWQEDIENGKLKSN